jgi:SAM-dependent methyltransferase
VPDVARTACGGCASSRLYQFLDLGKSPLADRFPASPSEPEEFYPLGAMVCEDCWLTQISHIVPDEDLYGDDYGFMSGSSPASVGYFERWAQWALGLFQAHAERLVVEIASNDGTLLGNFAKAGCAVLGVDPAVPAATAANQAGVPTLCEPFGWEVADRIRRERGPAGLVIACNVVAHVSDLFDFLSGIRRLISPGGIAIIEFQYLPRLLAGGQFDHVYHEHRAFFTLDSLARACEQAGGLPILAAEHVAAQGGSMRVIIGDGEPSPSVASIRESEAWLRDRSAYGGVQGRAEFVRGELLSILGSFADRGITVAGYAASAKSATLLNFCGIDTSMLSHVVDVTPGKIGRFTPGTGIPIVAPGERSEPGAYLLMAWNYLSAVLKREREYLGSRGGHLIVPVPVPVIL